MPAGGAVAGGVPVQPQVPPAAGGAPGTLMGGPWAALGTGGTSGDLETLVPGPFTRRKLGRLSHKAVQAAGEAFLKVWDGAEALGSAELVWARARAALAALDSRLPHVGGAGGRGKPASTRERAIRLTREGDWSRAAAALDSAFVGDDDAGRVVREQVRSDLPPGPEVVVAQGPVAAPDYLARVLGEVREAVRAAPKRRGAGPTGLYPDALHAVIEANVRVARAVAGLIAPGERFGPPAWLAAAAGIVIKGGTGKARFIASPEALLKLVERVLVNRFRAALRGMRHAAAPFQSGGAPALGVTVLSRLALGDVVICADGVNAYSTIFHSSLCGASPPQSWEVWLGSCLERRSVTLGGQAVALPQRRGAGLGGPLMPAAFSCVMDRLTARVMTEFPTVTARWYLDDLFVWGALRSEVRR